MRANHQRDRLAHTCRFDVDLFLLGSDRLFHAVSILGSPAEAFVQGNTRSSGLTKTKSPVLTALALGGRTTRKFIVAKPMESPDLRQDNTSASHPPS